MYIIILQILLILAGVEYNDWYLIYIWDYNEIIHSAGGGVYISDSSPRFEK